MRLLQPELGRVFNGDNALALRNVGRKRVQERRLAGAGTTRDKGVQAELDAGLQKLRNFRL